MSRLLAEPCGLDVAGVAALTDRQIAELYRRAAARMNGTPDVDRDRIPEPKTAAEKENALRSLLSMLPGMTPAKIEAEVKRQMEAESCRP